MRRVKRWRYYCEFCKKAGGSGFHVKRHEDSCTRNPARVCRMCAYHATNGGDSVQRPMPELIAALREGGLVAIRAMAKGCPVCILATILQDRIGRGVVVREMGGEDAENEMARYREFDFAAECKDRLGDIALAIADKYDFNGY